MLKFLIEACVHRRVAAVFFTAVVAVFGVRAYLDTPIEAFPDVTNAQVTVITQMPGYAAPEIERLIKKGAEVGKRLDFLIQELHREANTLGSKSSNLELTRISVDMKVLIEQLREQVQNLE